MSHEGTVYRRVRTLTRKVLDVLLLLLRRSAYQSDLPGLFQRLPGETPLELEYHEAEAGVKALRRRGFLAEVSDRRMASNGRVAYAVPLELGEMLTGLFRQETRTVGSVFSLEDHLTAITAAERQRLRAAFPALPESSDPSDVKAILGKGGATALLDRLDDDLKAVALYAIERHGGLMLRANWSARRTLRETRWNRERWTEALEGAGIGTLARLSLRSYGIACEDEALVVFDEILEDLYAEVGRARAPVRRGPPPRRRRRRGSLRLPRARPSPPGEGGTRRRGPQGGAPAHHSPGSCTASRSSPARSRSGRRSTARRTCWTSSARTRRASWS